ncbi:MAG: aminoacyl-tRNA hydrolase [Actinobacteria bacterium]|nr:aminoacyl-tRNA hydrolase [Actinomycetota bacterium]
MTLPASGPYLLVGLGNPGRAYRANRHSAGFMALDRLAASIGIAFSRSQLDALVTEGRLDGCKLILAKPQTYMNLVGRSVGALTRYYRIPISQLLVVCDDLDLPLGSLRLRPAGGTAGHKGMASILEHLGTPDFPRLRLGIGRPPGRMDPADYVLQGFAADEATAVESMLDRAVECMRSTVLDGIQQAMTRFNAVAE